MEDIPGPQSASTYDALPVFISEYDIYGNPSQGRGILGLFDLTVTPESASLASLRQSSLTDVLEVVDITNFLSLAPCADCVKVKSVAIDPNGNAVVTIGIKHPFDAGNESNPASGSNRADLHVFNVEGIIISSETGIPFSGIGQTAADFRLMNADGYTGYLDNSLDEIYYTDATIHPYITHFDDYSAGNFAPGNPTGFESVTTPPPSGNLVMAMGSDYDFQDYVFNIQGSMSFVFAVGCTYGVSATAKSERFTPEYRIPQHNKKSASEISVEIINNELAGRNTSSTADIEIHVVDINHGVSIGPNINQMLMDSSVSLIRIDIPGIMTTPIQFFGSTSISGTGHDPSDPLVYQALIQNTAGAEEGIYPGLIKITDTYFTGQNILQPLGGMDGIKRVDPFTDPIDGLFNIPEFATYQLFELEVFQGNLDPVCVMDIVTTDFDGWGYLDVEFDATQSYDPDPGDTLVFEWDFDNDGTFGESPDDDFTGPDDNPTHRYNDEYTGSVALKLTDGIDGESICYSAQFQTTDIFKPNTDLVDVSCYQALSPIGAGIGSGGEAVREFLFRTNKMRIRQDGTIEGAEFYIRSLQDTTGIFITVWRQMSDNLFDRIGESENLLTNLSVGLNDITFSSLISNVEEGDYYGLRVTQSGILALQQFTQNITNSGGYTYWFNSNPGNYDVNFYSGRDGAGSYALTVPIKLKMQAPSMVVIGDSIISGAPTTRSYIDRAFSHTLPDTTISTYLRTSFDVSAQNMGIGGNRIWQINNRFTPDCTDIKPNVIMLEGGVNDIGSGYTDTNWYINEVTEILDECVVNGQHVIVLKILPWTSGSYTRMTVMDNWNAALETLVGTYSGFIFVDAASAVGQFRPSGPPGNLWDIQPAYNADGIHFTPAGHQKIADTIRDTVWN